MNKRLQNLLWEYYGRLMFQEENTFVWTEKDKIIRKKNAVAELLDLEKDPTTMELIMKKIKQP